MLRSLRRVGVVALSETRRSGGSFDRKTTIALVLLGLASVAVTPVVTDGGLDFDRGIYRAAVTPDSPLLAALRGAPSFQVLVVSDPGALLAAGRADLAVDGPRVEVPPTDKGQAALAALSRAVRDLNYVRMLEEPDRDAAFPVRVTLVYEEQDTRSPGGAGGPPTSTRPTDRPEPPTGGAVSGGEGDDVDALPESRDGADGGFALLPPERSINTPETLSPPFPFRSLLLAYLFLVPMNFVVQVYAGSAIAERLQRRGEALLASPARPWEIVVGKALPYLLLMMALGAAIAVGIGGGWLSVVAVLPLALAFLGFEFVAAMFARSFRELTFLTVFSSVLLTVYAFLPAVFADVHPIALVSPITLVVMDLRGGAPGLGAVLYACAPLALFGLVCFVLGTALYREEDMFHQKPVHAKALDALARQVRGRGSPLWIPVLLLPMVLVAELLLVTFLFAWPVPVGLLGVLVAVALVEELFKAAPSYAAVRAGAVPRRRALLFGALVGAGFFLAEKGFLLLSLAGLLEVPAGSAVFGAAGSGAVGGVAPWLVAVLLLGPLVLHVGTATISAWGARHGRAVFLAALALAVAVHTAYNWTVVAGVGRLAG